MVRRYSNPAVLHRDAYVEALHEGQGVTFFGGDALGSDTDDSALEHGLLGVDGEAAGYLANLTFVRIHGGQVPGELHLGRDVRTPCRLRGHVPPKWPCVSSLSFPDPQ